MKNGYWVNTIYGRQWKSYDQENKENAIIVIVGLMVVIGFIIFN